MSILLKSSDEENNLLRKRIERKDDAGDNASLYFVLLWRAMIEFSTIRQHIGVKKDMHFFFLFLFFDIKD